jgi:hypothetical protein
VVLMGVDKLEEGSPVQVHMQDARSGRGRGGPSQTQDYAGTGARGGTRK